MRTRRPSAGVRVVVSHTLAATAMSAPWPALLAAVWSATGSDQWLGLTGAARLLPYVALSAVAGMLADRLPRLRVLRASTAARAVLLLGCAVAFTAGQLGPAVALAVIAVAFGTPAYPAVVAALPGLTPAARLTKLTSIVVTAEVTAFVVGPAVGGLIIGTGHPAASVWLAGALALAALGLLVGIRGERRTAPEPSAERGRLSTVFGARGVPLAIAMVALVNFAESGASVALASLNTERWGDDPRGFGVATAALGFGSLAAPLISRVLRLRGSLVANGLGFAAVGLAPVAAVAVAPLAALGASGTAVECASTDVLQRAVPDRARAFALGMTDSIMVAAAMIGSWVTPLLAGALGGPVTFVGLGLSLVTAGVIIRTRRVAEAPVPLPAVCHPESGEPTGTDLVRDRGAGAGPDRVHTGHHAGAAGPHAEPWSTDRLDDAHPVQPTHADR